MFSIAVMAVPPAGASDLRLEGPAVAEFVPGAGAFLRLTGRDFLRRSHYVAEGDSRNYLIEVETRSEPPLAESDDIAPPPRRLISVRALSAQGIGPVLRTLDVRANELRIDRMPLAEAETWGCCVQANTIATYDLLTGRLIAARSSDFDVLTATGLPRGGQGEAVAFQVFTFKAIEPGYEELASADPASLGVITLVREDVPVQRIELRVALGDPQAGEQVEWLNRVQWLDEADGKPRDDQHIVYDAGKPTGRAFTWAVDEGQRIVIPFDGERFDIARARLPARLKLIALPARP
ncbi:hypothetical protein DKG75_05475 [Zavarzinia compransoris]|uniref:Uncharacterized protein n=2 Tax=Zavarzinia compransoris TaxID=1264899 RepID=A0A317EBM2_9PROT|nr:hypothetical protein DKG75_05475 [Zavarzinia compransoris]